MRELLENAILFFGEGSQIGVAQEECAELIQALSKYVRNKGNLDNVAEEIADVEIMCEQLRIIFENDKRVEEWKDYKLNRLESIINGNEAMRY